MTTNFLGVASHTHASHEIEQAMESFSNLIASLKKIAPLNEQEVEAIVKIAKESTLRKKSSLLEPGQICQYTHFVTSGLLRLYFEDERGKQHNIQFGMARSWITDMTSFQNRAPSRLSIEALDTTAVLSFHREDLSKLRVDFPRINEHFRVLGDRTSASFQTRLIQNLSSTAEERVVAFEREHPGWDQLIPYYHIASYLGMTPEFLSKVRKRIAKS